MKDRDPACALPPAVPPEQLVYARWLDIGIRFGLAVLVTTFALYVFGLLPPLIPLERLPQVWGLSVDRYLAATGLPSGWGWLAHANKGDLLNFTGVAALGFVTLICFIRLLLAYWQGGNRIYAAIALAEIVVLSLAAAGVAGH